MFTGITECLGTVFSVTEENGITVFEIQSPVSGELKVDQSVMHNGICLTVTSVQGGTHQVQAIPETLEKTNAGTWEAGTLLNLERSMAANGRFDGHIVQGHVDCTAELVRREAIPGQLSLYFQYPPDAGITVSKGSVCVNGISLTVVASETGLFSVALIPYTIEHTNLGQLNKGDRVNIEFDIIGKYLQKFATAP